MNGIDLFNNAIKNKLINNVAFLKGRMGYMPGFTGIAGNLKRQEKVRTEILKSRDITVPPILIISVTRECNLACKGCYDCALDREDNNELTVEDIDRIVGEGVESGVGLIFFAGGEPLLKKGLLDIPEKYSKTLFVLFTNGLLIDDALMNRLGEIKNIVPALSLEGNEESTDVRRGPGVFNAIHKVMKNMDKRHLLFGASITLTRNNYREVMNTAFLQGIESSGCRTLFLIEYVPCDGDPELCLTEEQKRDLILQMERLPQEYSMLPVALPGDEEKFGGCLAAGRGFLHISSTGDVEACPFAPFSDVNLKNLSFLEALESRLLGKIRENHHLLEEAEGGCTLFENQTWVESLMAKQDVS
ncbi:MAG: radical SAM protein [Spirochaetales bacterium]|nr:radical SAM protein [Spirochaetales bacterium]